jgi:hypothetical protein
MYLELQSDLMQRKRRMAVFLRLPLAVFIWLIGSTLMYFVPKRKPIQAKVAKQSELAFSVSVEKEVLVL